MSKKRIIIGGIIVLAAILLWHFNDMGRNITENPNEITRMLVGVNGEYIAIGECHILDMNIPDDYVSTRYEDADYMSKRYDSVEKLEQDCSINIMSGKDNSHLKDVVLNVKNKKEVYISLMNQISKPIQEDDTSYDDVPMSIHISFVIDKKDKVIINDFEDNAGTDEVATDMIYSIADKYWDDTLETEVVLISAKSKNQVMDDKQSIYYAFFVKDDMCYQLTFKYGSGNIKEKISSY